ncbi:MAG: nucleoside phosphorylase [Chloroflexi bacterium]|nr:nucleoside phosphorylase [Chloroflexota bacterium]
MSSPVSGRAKHASGPDFLTNQGADEPVITVAHQREVLGRRSFRGEPASERPPIAETVVLSILGHEEMDWCLEGLGAANGSEATEERGWLVSVDEISVVGPCVYAPKVAGTFESLKQDGVKTVIAFGWCGAVHPEVRVGDILLAGSVIREEGASYHYLPADADPLPSPTVNGALRSAAAGAGVALREGPIWTTDAPYRETRHKVKNFAARGVLGVDMETSAIVSLGSAMGIDVGVLLLVSDELWDREWRWGVPTPAFAHARRSYVQIAADAALTLANES